MYVLGGISCGISSLSVLHIRLCVSFIKLIVDNDYFVYIIRGLNASKARYDAQLAMLSGTLLSSH